MLRLNFKRAVALIVFAIFIVSIASAQVVTPKASHVYLAQWEWFTEREGGVNHSYWRAPFGDEVGSLDLRSIPQMSKAGGIPEGYGVFVYKEQKIIPGANYLGTDLDSALTTLEKNSIQSKLSVSLTSVTVLDFLWDSLTKHSDPTGLTAPKPLLVESDGMVRLHLGGFSAIRVEPANEEHLTRTIEVFRVDYVKGKQNGLDSELLKKWTGDTMNKLRGKSDDATARSILPVGHKNDGWKFPTTDLSENWNCPSSASLDCQINWVVFGGDINLSVNSAVTFERSGFQENARTATALSSADHNAEALLNSSNTAVFTSAGTVVRKDNTDTNTFYHFEFRLSGADRTRLFKQVNGSNTKIGGDETTTNFDNTVGKLTVSGSSLDVFSNGVEWANGAQTDTAITGNLYPGIHGNGNQPADAFNIWDNFFATDGVAVTTTCDDNTVNNDWVIDDECYFKDTTINLGSGTVLITANGVLGLDNSFVHTRDFVSCAITSVDCVRTANGGQVISNQ